MHNTFHCLQHLQIPKPEVSVHTCRVMLCTIIIFPLACATCFFSLPL